MSETTPPATQSPKLIDVKVSRTIAASPADIYDTWLDTTKPGGPWFGAARVILDASVDGLFYHSVSHAGREWAHYGRFLQLERGARIRHTWVSEATRGIETVVTITLVPRGDQTEVTLLHERVPDDQMGRGHEDGWSWVLGSVAERFSGAAK